MTRAATGFWYFGFLLTGTLTTLLGPILPRLSPSWHINDSHAGLLFAIQFLASLCGSLAGGSIAARVGVARIVALGLVLCAVGLTFAAFETWPIAAGGVAVWGLGLGLVIPLVNVTVAAEHPARRAEALNVLNFVWGFGAVTSSPMVTAVVRFGLRPLLLTLAAIFLLTSLGILLSPKKDTAAVRATNAAVPPRRWSLIVWTGVFLFLYVGVENALSGWLPTYVTRELGTLAGAAWTQAGFWTALLAGRLFAPMLLKRGLESRALLLFGLSTAALGEGILIGWQNSVASLSGGCLAGLGLSSVFPTAVAMFTEKAGSTSTRTTGIVFSFAAFGGVVLPWFVGLASSQLGSIRWALAAPWACVIAMLTVVGVVNPWRNEEGPPQARRAFVEPETL